jgi:hypothetical protein
MVSQRRTVTDKIVKKEEDPDALLCIVDTHTHVYLMLAMWLFLPRENFFFFLYLLASVTVHLELTQEERINFDSIPKGALFKCSS